MDIERNDFMDGRTDAEGRRPRRVQASAAYEAGYLEGIALRSERSRPESFTSETIQGMRVTAAFAGDGVWGWSVEHPQGGMSAVGSAPDQEIAIASAEGWLRSNGFTVARRHVISDQVHRLHPSASTSDVERITDRVVGYMLTKEL